MKITFITIFPDLIKDFFKEGLLNKAKRTKKIVINVINPRDFTKDKHKTVDDAVYGGGSAGLIMKVEPIVLAIKKAVGKKKNKTTLIVLLSPSKNIFNQKIANKFSKYKHIVFICGRYEGVDARVEKYIDIKLSLGEFVLMGGEVAALTMTEAITRLLPGVIGKDSSLEDESYGSKFYLEYPQYTRPEEFKGLKVPKVLLSGNHKKIAEWRKKHSSCHPRTCLPGQGTRGSRHKNKTHQVTGGF